MKKLLLPMAIAAALPVSAMADVTVYGKANVSVQMTSENDSDITELNSNASRIGVKGKHKISDGLTAIYKFEYETYVDDGQGSSSKGSDTFEQRNIYAGLEGGFGQVIAGKFDTPMKKSQKKVDLFNDLDGDIKNIITNSDNRSSNSLQYSTGKAWGDVKLAVDYIMSEEDGVDSRDDGISSALSYDNKKVYLSVAYDQDVIANDVEVIRLVGQFNLGDFQLGALVEDQSWSANGLSDDRAAWFLSGQYKVGKVAYKLQYGESEMKVGEDNDGETLSVGVDYKLAKNTKVFGFYTVNDKTYNATEFTAAVTDEFDTFGLGLEVKF